MTGQTEFLRLPQLTTSMEIATVGRWLKAEGEAVESGSAVVEIETDKAAVELEAPFDGILESIIADTGKSARVGEPLARLSRASPAGKRAPTTAVITQASASREISGVRVLASPLARRLARDAGVDIAALSRSVGHRRVRRDDVKVFAQSSEVRSDESRALAESKASLSERVSGRNDGDALRSMSPMRAAIARRLSQAKTTIPHFYVTADCHADRLLAFRDELNGWKNPATSVSITDRLVRACALALVQTPDVNVAWTERGIAVHRCADIAVAIAVSEGLFAPVIARAEQKMLGVISRELKDLRTRAAAGTLRPTELEGGAVTISNLGMYRVREFAAIINPPSSCILAVGRCEKRPLVDGDRLGIGLVMTLTLSADHRLIDGILAAEFLSNVISFLERPASLAV